LRAEKIGWASGIVVNAGDIRLLFDPTLGRPLDERWNIFITHAHTDHTYGFGTAARKYSTQETLQIYEALRERQVKNFHALGIGQTARFGDVEVRAVNAGHMLGSCQFEVTTPEFTAVYTGDINCVDTLTTQAAALERCDYLIIEATYGHPMYVFPRRSLMYADIVKWALAEINAGKVPAFQVYSSGKPQEVVRLFNVYTRIPVICNPAIARANRAHTENGVKLEYVDSSTEEGRELLRKGGCVYVTTTASDHLPRNTSRAVTTGWALREAFRNCTSFPLSSHADYEQLVQFISTVNPKRVYIFTGYEDVLSAQIRRKLGIEASALPVMAQTKLVDFGLEAI